MDGTSGAVASRVVSPANRFLPASKNSLLLRQSDPAVIDVGIEAFSSGPPARDRSQLPTALLVNLRGQCESFLQRCIGAEFGAGCL